MPRPEFIRLGDIIVPVSAILRLDVEEFATEGSIVVHHNAMGFVTFNRAEGDEAIRALMALYPAALEGSPVRWIRRSWTVHNLLGHPLMEVLARLGFAKLGLRVHDSTIPGADRIRKA